MKPFFSVIPVVLSSTGDVFEKPAAYSTGIDPEKDLIPIDYNGVMSGIRDLSEDASFRRYSLLNKLINNEPKLRTAASNMYAQLTNMYNVLKSKQRGVDNITQVIDADASAGGIRATVQSLKEQVPQTSKMLRKMVETLFKNLATDSVSINRTLVDTEEEYNARIKRSAKTVTGMLVSMDSTFANAAYAQAQAMKRSAGTLQSQFTPEIQSTQQSVNGVLSAIQRTSQKANGGASKLSLALSDAAEMPLEIESTHQTSLSAVTSQLQRLLNSQQDKAEKTINTASDHAITKVESSGMKMAKSVESLLNQIQSQLLSNVSAIEADASKMSKKVSKDAGRWNKKMIGSLTAVQGATSTNLTSIQSRSEKVQVDSSQLATDSQNMLNQFDGSISRLSSDFAVDTSKLGQAIPGHMQGVLTEAVRLASSVNTDMANELSRQNTGIGSILETADSVSSSFGSVVEKPINSFKRTHSDTVYRMGANLKSAESLVDENSQFISANLDKAIGEHTDRLDNLNALMSGGIDELKSVVAESEDANQSGLEELRMNMNKKSVDRFGDIIERLRGNVDGSSAGLGDFLSSVMSPNNERTQTELGQLTSLLSTLLTAGQVTEDARSNVWSSAISQHKNRLGKLRDMGNKVSHLWGTNSAMIDLVKSNATEAISGLKNFLRQESAKQVVSDSDYARSSLSTIKRLLDNSVVEFWNRENMSGIAVANVSSKVENAASLLTQLKGVTDKGVSRLGSFAVSLGAQIESQRKQDLKESGLDMDRFQKNLMDSLRGRVVTEADAGLSEITATANSNNNRSSVVKDLMNSLKAHMTSLENDMTVAANVNDRRVADTDRSVGLVAAKVNDIRVNMESSFKSLHERIEDEIVSKSASLNETERELNSQLGTLETSITKSGETLQRNLLMYQGKIEQIIAQIKSYMNLSSAADELAIRNGIAKELGMVNSSAVQFASIRDGVNDRMKNIQTSQKGRKNMNSKILSDLIDSAESLAREKQIASVSNRERLVATGLVVDASANALRNLVGTNSKELENAITESKRKTERNIKSLNGAEMKRYSQISERSRDIAAKARSDYVSQLDKMSGLDDNIALTSKQLAAVIGNSNSTLADISTSVMNHMDLTVATQAKLNTESSKRIASIGDVMGIFSSVITGFVDEVERGMRTIISDMDSIDSWSAKKMEEMRTRSADELTWLKSGIDRVKEQFSAEIESEKTVQDSLMAGLIKNNEEIAKIESQYEDEARDVHDRVQEEREKVKSFGPFQMNKVRSWINERRRNTLRRK